MSNEDKMVEAHIDGTNIVIKIPLLYLPGIVQYHPELEEEFRVTDIIAFAKDLVREINQDDNDGAGTPFTRMFDECVCRAIHGGAEGIEEVDTSSSSR